MLVEAAFDFEDGLAQFLDRAVLDRFVAEGDAFLALGQRGFQGAELFFRLGHDFLGDLGGHEMAAGLDHGVGAGNLGGEANL